MADPFDRERLRAAVRMCLQLAESDELKGLIGERIEPADADLVSDEALDRWMLREAHTYSHISGTCKMGPPSDAMAVVDQYGKVYGLEGLRVADASIMPDLGAGGHQPHGVDDGRAFGGLCAAGEVGDHPNKNPGVFTDCEAGIGRPGDYGGEYTTLVWCSKASCRDSFSFNRPIQGGAAARGDARSPPRRLAGRPVPLHGRPRLAASSQGRSRSKGRRLRGQPSSQHRLSSSTSLYALRTPSGSVVSSISWYGVANQLSDVKRLPVVAASAGVEAPVFGDTDAGVDVRFVVDVPAGCAGRGHFQRPVWGLARFPREVELARADGLGVNAKGQVQVRRYADVEVAGVVADVGLAVEEDVGTTAEVGDVCPQKVVDFIKFFVFAPLSLPEAPSHRG